MGLRNKVTLIGRTGKEVEVHNFESGNTKASVYLATTEYYKNAKGEKVEQTEWHNIVAFGKLAEIMQKYIQKGQEIAIEGKLTYRSYEDQQGVKKYITEIIVSELLMLGKSNGESNAKKSTEPNQNPLTEEEDDLPF